MSLNDSLTERIAARIAQTGPITVAAFMAACLHDPQFGYYATRPSLGAEGDFITAPLVSQMFGELIGLWAAQTWIELGRPAPVRLVEIGPGDGTLMRDALRGARVVPPFLDAAELWLVETSGPLRDRQRQALTGHTARWTTTLDGVSAAAPMIAIANELLDCLPARQFQRTERGWAERMVGLDGGALAFGLTPAPEALIPAPLRTAPPGSVVEVSAAQEALGRAVGQRVVRDGGAALFIDYGRYRPGVGDTLQALRRHEKVDVLASAGAADLTVHADFPAFAAAARSAGAQTTPILTQSAFLRALGIEARAEALAHARPDRADVIGRQLERLIASDQMGTLFKALAIHAPGLPVPGF